MALEYRLNISDDGTPTLKKIGGEALKTKDSLDKADKAASSFSKSLGVMKTAFATSLGSVMTSGVTALKDLAKEMVNNYDSAAKLSNNVGVAADSIIGIRHAAELSGVGAEAMDKNLAKLSKTIAQAASGSKEASAIFGKMGVSFKDDKGLKSADQVLLDLADKFKDLPPGTQKATYAMDLFGKSGASMVSMLKDGKEGLRAMIDEGKATAGNVENVADAMQKLNDASTQAKAAITGLIAEIAGSDWGKSAVGAIKEYAEGLVDIVRRRKQAAEYEKQGDEADFRRLTIQKAQIEYGDLDIATKQKQMDALDKQREALQKKLKLDYEEMDLIEKKAKVSVLDRKDDRTYAQNRDLGVYKRQLAAIDEKAAAEKKAADDKRIAAEQEEENYKKLKKAEEDLSKAREAAAKKYADEGKRLDEWLAKYEQSKLSEKEIAKSAYEDEIKNFDALLARKKISETDYAVYAFQADQKLKDKEKEIDEKEKEERIKSEEATQSKIWELRRIAANGYGEIAAIEIVQIEAKYKKELELAKKNNIDIATVEKAMQAEIDAAQLQAHQNEFARMEQIRSYREIAATTEAEKMQLQIDGINARYEIEAEKAKGNAELIIAIENAKNVELKRLAEQERERKIAEAQQAMDSVASIAEAIAVYGKTGGNAMKAIAISQATINTYLAATKAATAAAFPLNAVLVAGAISQGMVQIAKIKAQKFASGGMIRGMNRLIMANEEGEEAILNTRAVRAVGGEAGVNALNRGTNVSNSYDNRQSSSTIVINAPVMTQKVWNDEIVPVMRRAERRR